ncbi:MAG TPA: hypothetical protein VF877_00510 [Gaiellaceae bacterium]
MEETSDREQLDRRQRDEVARAEEDVELGRVQPLDGLVVEREVQNGEEVLGILVDLRALALGEDVFDVERMPAEALREVGGRVRIGRVEVNPGQAVGGELSGLASRADDRLVGAGARTRALDAGQAWHRY